MEPMQPSRTHHSTRPAAPLRRAKKQLARRLRRRHLRGALAGSSLAALTLLTSARHAWSQPHHLLGLGERPGTTHALAQGSAARRLLGRTTFESANGRKDLFVARCVGVLDGDTILVEHEGQTDKVDLWGIDCPELSQPYGQQARQFTINRVLGQMVRVRVKGHHKGRVLAFVDSGPGSTLNEELVGGGLGWFYPRQSKDTFLIPLLQDTARQDRRGLWADKDPVAPWQWRKSH